MNNKPHILLITTDHWPNSLLGANRHPVIQTPTLDALARSGTLFTRAYSECPVCAPARKTLMTGRAPRFDESLSLDGLPTLAQTFRDAGYQTYAAGKLHVHPQGSRIGFDDVLLAEEGRIPDGSVDDYELFLGDSGYTGQQFAHGMANNDYINRPWHLPEDTHLTNWTTQQMVRLIKRRDPTRPGFWFLSHCYPHPPLTPLQCYIDMYRNIDVDMPYYANWAKDIEKLPFTLKSIQGQYAHFTENLIRSARQAFYALCTHIDHQLRVVIGTLREEGILNNTILMFTSDHGDMLGNHGLWGKRLFYEDSANVPMLLVGTASDESVGHHRLDERLVGWQDIMPTLLHLAGIAIPDTVEGIPMIGEERREWLYGQYGEDTEATRMIHEGRFKLIYYAVGNCLQLFDLQADPKELNNLANSPEHAEIQARLMNLLVDEFYGEDVNWVQKNTLVGLPNRPYNPSASQAFSGQRGIHWPYAPSGGH